MYIWMIRCRETGAIETETRNPATAQAWRDAGYLVACRFDDED